MPGALQAPENVAYFNNTSSQIIDLLRLTKQLDIKL